MALLAFDCTLRRFSAVLLDRRGSEIGALRRGAGEWRGEEIVALLDGLCRRHGCGWRTLEAVAATVGPGSFTGVRTAVAVVRALALATGLPVHPLGTLEVLAATVRERAGDRPLAAVLPGKRGHLYLQTFDADAAPLGPPASVDAAEVAQRIPAAAAAVSPDPTSLAALLGSGREILEGAPEAWAVARLAHRRRAAGERGLAGHRVEPLYLRAADADPRAGRPLLAPAE